MRISVKQSQENEELLLLIREKCGDKVADLVCEKFEGQVKMTKEMVKYVIHDEAIIKYELETQQYHLRFFNIQDNVDDCLNLLSPSDSNYEQLREKLKGINAMCRNEIFNYNPRGQRINVIIK